MPVPVLPLTHRVMPPVRRAWIALGCSLLLAACASPQHKAPVEERNPPARVAKPAKPAASSVAGDATAAGAAVGADAVKPLPGIENAGKPGYYTIKPGDTLIRIGLDNGQNWRDLVRWNGIENPNLIEVGQVVRVVPPAVDAAAVVARGVPAARVDARPLDAKPSAAAVAGSAASAATAGASAPNGAAPAAREAEDEPTWAWPAAGAVAGGFEEGRTRGLTITGKAGDAVLAAADGRVIYAGSALRGYGNLLIVKHNATYLTAYAHNQTLLVKEDQAVRRGQKIAEMGASDADRVQLHFEIRRQGKPVDPARLLPPR